MSNAALPQSQVRMWLECIRYRFQLDPEQDGLELAQAAALQSLRHSPRCRSWRVMPSASDPSLSILEIEWDAGPSLVPFRGSEEFAALHAALTKQVQALDEADYRADARLLRRALGGPDAILRLAEDIAARVMREPELAARFHSRDGSRRARLGLWVLEVIGGPALFSSNYPGAARNEGPLVGEPLNLDERELFLEVVRECLPGSASEPGPGVLGALRAHLPLYPPPQSQSGGELLLEGDGSIEDDLPLDGELLLEGELLDDGRLLEGGFVPRAYLEAASPPPDDEVPSSGLSPSDVVDGELPGLRDGEPGERTVREPGAGDRPTWSRRRLGRRHRVFDSGVFPQPRRQTAKR